MSTLKKIEMICSIRAHRRVSILPQLQISTLCCQTPCAVRMRTIAPLQQHDVMTHSKQAQTHSDRELRTRRCELYSAHPRQPVDRADAPTFDRHTPTTKPRSSRSAACYFFFFYSHLFIWFFLELFLLHYRHPSELPVKNLRAQPLHVRGPDDDSRGWSVDGRGEGEPGRCGGSPAGRSSS